ncbi:pyridoxal phosphate-dependent transferase [Phakopsora pachyrhizi]|uniref:Pyridoxal phosphate-dependent transferase n=1 Tax=Phakopsora pachyrhizi TaxID=170000 RepID=A0AAV0AF45_PHAPC|nr:pyridoxal phosphate-dependent transferase [Phakopsora pachyrhizi]KAI8456680.1 pyridoxal phosphate-dependent transferase [Phakopsora pachyrhizi]CAH7665787.1 pyridoxal phosphate-dependent transferase [Phakopsora pachyrhizi]
MSTLIDYDKKFISRAGKRWEPSGIRGLLPLENVPGMISMLVGKPNPDTFPFSSITLTLKAHDATGDVPETLELKNRELDDALQYGPTAGLSSLLDWVIGLQQRSHGRGKPEEEGWRCSIGAGSQELMEKAFEAVCDPEDSILIESPVYSGTIGFLKPSERKLVEIKTDEYGMSGEDLERVLTSWHTDPSTRDFKFPKVVYTIPTGSNPTGCSASLERKRYILDLVRKHDILLFEDDAYFFVHFNPSARAPSYFSLEKSDGGQRGRVVRFDSLSKIISSGIRLGFVTGPQRIIEIINLHTSNTNLQPASLSQAIVAKLFQHWGYERFEKHCEHVSQFYAAKLEIVEAAARKYLTGIAEWNKPVAGMFLWVKLLIGKPGEEGDSSTLIQAKAFAKGVLAVPGFSFIPSGSKSTYVRLSFSLIDPELADEGIKRLASVVLEARAEAGLA